MKAVCKNNPDHREFITTAHVMQDWTVDLYGNWIKTNEECVQVSFEPNPDNIWTCAICGSEAEVTAGE